MNKFCFLVFIACFLTVGFLFSFHPVYSAPAVPILMYHYIRDYHNPYDKTGENLSVSPTDFGAQMNYLSTQGYTPITLDMLFAIFSHKASAPAKPIVITFDDGYADFYNSALPILRAYNFHAVAFISTGLIGRPNYMSWNNISDLVSSGLIELEAHTISHSSLPKLSSEALVREITVSKQTLESYSHYPVNFIAYPYGAVNGAVMSQVQKAGYVGGLGTWFGFAGAASFNLPRIRVSGGMSLSTFASRL